MDQADAAIFDMDGVLVDTYQAHYRSWLEMTKADLVVDSLTELSPETLRRVNHSA